MRTILKLNGITKHYGKNEVLSSVDFQVQAGEIHGLVGENGAGKSTLLKILLGSAEISHSGGYEGEVYVNGRLMHISSPAEAARLGIGMVHQEFALIPDMNLVENVMIGREKLNQLARHMLGSDLALIDWQQNEDEATKVLQSLGISMDTKTKAAAIPVSVKQFVELAREISRDHLKLLILDEPTAALGEDEATRLLDAVKGLAERGIGIILVSHRLEEVMAYCDRVTVLRDGRVTAAFSRQEGDYSVAEIARFMLGKSVTTVKTKPRTIPQEPILCFQDFSVAMPGEQLAGLNLAVYRGEILGLAGLFGHGKTAIGNGMMGLYPTSGQVFMDNELLDTNDAGAIIARGVFFLHEERRRTGLLLDQSVADNVVFAAVQRKNRFLKRFPIGPLRLVDRKQVGRYTKEAIERFDIRCQGIRQPVRFLSGGNQQKVCLTRALALEPRVLLVNEPTRGIDIGAKEMILDALVQINREVGTTIICASSELSELRRIADRIVVLYEGRVLGIFPPDAPDMEFALSFAGKRLAVL
ncbi:MAG: sugar ABC transporter ATP-binding protein [Ignavibacteriales bacterium]